MNKLLFLLISAMLFLSSCEKDKKTDTTLHGTRLKTYTMFDMTYTIIYNSFNKIDSIRFDIGEDVSYTYCKYKPDHSLDSIISLNVDGNSYSREGVESDNFRITKYEDDVITYNTNNTISTIQNFYFGFGTNRFQYSGDSVLIYYKYENNPEILDSKYYISSTIKNPFYITGFEAERFLLFYLLSFASPPFTAMLPFAETRYKTIDQDFNYIYEGNFNGYPLKRTAYGITEIFTYEEF